MMACLVPSFLYVFVTLPMLISAQSSNNITIGSSLTAGANPSSFWVSPSKDFAFGFQEIEPGSFLLAIWFNLIPEKTITWSANRDKLAPRGSKMELTGDQGLVLTGPNGQPIWQSNLLANAGKLGYGAMLDTGNLIVSAQAGSVVWQSFDHPTDTILPTQTVNLGTQLIAQFSRNNYSSGRFMMQLGTDGNLGLYTNHFPLFNSVNHGYWNASGSGNQVVFNQSGNLYLAGKNGNILTNVFVDEVTKDFYQRVIVEYDGVLRHYVYPKSSSSRSGSNGWSTRSFFPKNICTAVIQQTGSGVCGFNAYCSIGNDDRPNCSCPPGYTPLDPGNEMSGCSQNFTSQSCHEPTSQQGNQFGFNVLINVDWPLSDYEYFPNVSHDWCRDVCLGDCFCAVSVFRQGTRECWKKKLPLSNGKQDISVDRTTFIKISTNNGYLTQQRGKSKNRVWGILVGTLGFVNIALVGFLFVGYFSFSKKNKSKQGGTSRARVNEGYSVRSFTYKELVEATDDFKEEIGSGAFGVVYKGILSGPSGLETYIAVKRVNNILRDADREFKAEVNAIAHTHHKNLVRLIGYCDENEHRILVYEYMSNGALSDRLYVDPKLPWEKRLQIALGIARGLFYLHEDCSSQIIHCDIKPQNILLDDEHNARISDFGLAKLLKLDQTHTNTVARGTRGYVAPEWFNLVPNITAKVDVYSFGILLLEIICCRRNVPKNNGEEIVSLLTDKVFECYEQGKMASLVEDDEEALGDKQGLERIVKVAMWCIQNDPSLRPTMRMVVQMLEGLLKVPEPPFPSDFYSM